MALGTVLAVTALVRLRLVQLKGWKFLNWYRQAPAVSPEMKELHSLGEEYLGKEIFEDTYIGSATLLEPSNMDLKQLMENHFRDKSIKKFDYEKLSARSDMDQWLEKNLKFDKKSETAKAKIAFQKFKTGLKRLIALTGKNAVVQIVTGNWSDAARGDPFANVVAFKDGNGSVLVLEQGNVD